MIRLCDPPVTVGSLWDGGIFAFPEAANPAINGIAWLPTPQNVFIF